MNSDQHILAVLRFAVERQFSDEISWNPTTLAPAAMCSDLFEWGTADCEEITPDNFPELKRAVADVSAIDRYSSWGPELFCARVRKMRPQGACYRSIPPLLTDLFDACGPERKVDMCNPQTREQGIARRAIR